MTESKLSSMCHAVDEFVQAIGSFVNEQGLEVPPREGSLGSREITRVKKSPDDETFDTICFQAWQQIEAAGDYLFAVPRLLAEPAMSIAPFACARGVLEASAEVRWLLDGAADSEIRVARSLALRFRGQAEQAKFSDAWGSAVQKAHAVRRAASIIEAASSRGIELRTNRQGQTIGIGHAIPSETVLARDYLGAESDYRLLSAVTHSQGAFLLASSFRRSERRGFVVKALDARMALYLLVKPTTWFARAAWTYFVYVGWNNRELSRLLESAFNAVGLSDKERFWRDELIRP